MESGVSAGECVEADPLIMSAGMSHRAITERILELADEAGYRAALIDATDATVTAWPRFAWTVRAAAHGLGLRGLAEGTRRRTRPGRGQRRHRGQRDPRGRSRLLPDPPQRRPVDIAARLNACGARVLITSAPLAELAAEAADRSRVRQVITFGEAAGTTRSARCSSQPGTASRTSRTPWMRAIPWMSLAIRRVTARRRSTAARGRWPGFGRELTHRDVVVAAPPCGDGPAYTSLLDLTLLTGAMLVAAPLPLVAAAMRVYKGTAAIIPRGTHVPNVPPEQVFPVA